MRTVAEGVETEQQLDELTRLGCTQAQGHYFREARPAEIGFAADAARAQCDLAA
jgi:EAL domain-containing protein (putative c-di-GMP-specific phosphodiesterase class I)